MKCSCVLYMFSFIDMINIVKIIMNDILELHFLIDIELKRLPTKSPIDAITPI